MKRKKKNYKYFFHRMGIVISIFLLITMVLNILTPNKDFSAKENRVLSSRPILSMKQLVNGDFGSQYETYANDQFFFRDFWIQLKSLTDLILGQRDEKGVYLCKDGYVMESFVKPSEEHYDNLVSSITDFAKRHPELTQYALIAPNAVNILSNKLPAFAPIDDQNEYLDSLHTSLEKNGITIIDVRDTLREHSDEAIFYKTDHHWTSLGAYYSYLYAAPILSIDPTEIEYEMYPISYSFQGTLSAKSGFHANMMEEMNVFLPKTNLTQSVVNYIDEQKKTASFYVTDKLKTRDKYATFFGGNHAQVKIGTPIDDYKTLLIFKDSYANCFVPFLAPYYQKIIMIDPRYYYGNIEELIQVEDIQEVLYLYNANTFFSDTSLEMILTTEE